MRSIHAISYQRKITGYNKDSCFPTEMTVMYIVDVKCVVMGSLMYKVLEIKEVESGFEVEFERGFTLCLSDKEKDIEVLYEE